MRKAIFSTLVVFFLSLSVLGFAETTQDPTPQVTAENSTAQNSDAVKPVKKKKKKNKNKNKKAKRVNKPKTKKAKRTKTKKPKIKNDQPPVQD